MKPADPLRLSELQPGQKGAISAIDTGEELFHRLAALGFRVGRPLEVMRRAQFSGPLQIRLGTTDVILRLVEADKIMVVPAANGQSQSQFALAANGSPI